MCLVQGVDENEHNTYDTYFIHFSDNNKWKIDESITLKNHTRFHCSTS